MSRRFNSKRASCTVRFIQMLRQVAIWFKIGARLKETRWMYMRCPTALFLRRIYTKIPKTFWLTRRYRRDVNHPTYTLWKTSSTWTTQSHSNWQDVTPNSLRGKTISCRWMPRTPKSTKILKTMAPATRVTLIMTKWVHPIMTSPSSSTPSIQILCLLFTMESELKAKMQRLRYQKLKKTRFKSTQSLADSATWTAR